MPWPEWEHREHRAELAEIHVPAGHRVLLRGEAGHERGDRRRGGRREDGRHARAQVRGERAGGRGVTREVARAETVDHEDADIAVAGDLVGEQCTERRIVAAHAEPRDHGRHQVDDAAAGIVGLHCSCSEWLRTTRAKLP